jgi:hypothetical protein
MKNVGGMDRMLRIVVGAGLTWYAFTSGTTWAYIGLLPLATGLMGFCPAYCPLKLSTACCSGGSCCDSKKSCDSGEKK